MEEYGTGLGTQDDTEPSLIHFLQQRLPVAQGMAISESWERDLLEYKDQTTDRILDSMKPNVLVKSQDDEALFGTEKGREAHPNIRQEIQILFPVSLCQETALSLSILCDFKAPVHFRYDQVNAIVGSEHLVHDNFCPLFFFFLATTKIHCKH